MANLLPLSEVTEFIKNGLSVKQDESAGGLPITRIETISHWEINPSKCGYAGLQLSDVSDRLLKEGDILFSHINSLEHLGKTAIYESNPPALVHGMNLLSIRPDKDKVEPRYLLHLLRSKPVHAQVMRAANKSVNQASVSATNVKKIQVKIPELEEQKRIAKILDAADALRAKRRESLAQLDALLQSTFLDLFGDIKTNSKKWEMRTIGSLVIEMRGGASLKPDDFVEEGFPILHKGAIKKHGLVEIDVGKKAFSTPEYALGKPGSLVDASFVAVTLRDLVPTGPSIGLAANLKRAACDEYLLAQGAYGLLLDEKHADADYFVALSNDPGFRTELKKFSVGSTQIHIRGPVYKNISIPVPPLDLQRRYAGVVQAVNDQKKRLMSHHEELGRLFDSLQTTAFTGEL